MTHPCRQHPLCIEVLPALYHVWWKFEPHVIAGVRPVGNPARMLENVLNYRRLEP